MSPERRILIGRMVGAFGISGEIKCQSFADPPQQLLKYKPLILVHEGREQVLESLSGRMTAKGPVIRLSDVDDRDAAQEGDETSPPSYGRNRDNPAVLGRQVPSKARKIDADN